jgi:hypothetical protein
MLTIPVDALLCPYPGNVIIDCEDGCAVKRDGDWRMEPKYTHAELEAEFYRSTTKAEMLETLQNEWRREYAENVRDGEIRKDRKEHYLVGYIASPEYFDERIAGLEKFRGELTPADKAWIKNTRELIAKYHELYEKDIKRWKPY